MKFVVCFMAALCLAAAATPLPAYATETQKKRTWGPATVRQSGPLKSGELDRLFDALRTAPTELDSRSVADQIWLHWMRAPDEDSAELLNRALRARGGYNFKKALGFLDTLVEKHPDYAEGWNQRAYIHFLLNDDEKSLADCEMALELEPRHFGCLSGMARILIQKQGRLEAGEGLLRRAMKLHPWIYERKLLEGIPGADL